jgi:phage gp29-like protein
MGVITWLRAAASRLTRPVAIVDSPSVYDQNERIGGSLTPQDVSQIYREADTGYMWRLVDLADESRQKDCHLQSILFTRESSVAGLDWQITPASNTAKDKKIAAWCDEWMRGFGADDPGPEPRDLPNLISHLQGAVYYGYAVAQILWERSEGKIIPVGAEPVHPRRFCYEPDHGRLHFWDNNGTVPYPGVSLVETYPGHFIQYQPRLNGGVATREGLMRVLLWAATFRNWALSDWLKLAEIAWKPWRIGKYNKKDSSKEDIAILLRALRELSSSGVAMLPDSVEYAIEWAKASGSGGNGGEHAALCAFLAAEMTKAVLGATLGVDQGRVGSQALGNVHERRMYSAFEWDALNIASVLRRQMIATAVRKNFGVNARIPGFAFLTEDAADFEATARGFLYLRQAGLRVAAKDPRDRLGLSEPLDGDEMLDDVADAARLPRGVHRDGEDESGKDGGDKQAENDAAKGDDE